MNQKEATREYNKQYYQKNKAKILENIKLCVSCPHCQKEVTLCNMSRHQKSIQCKKKQAKNDEVVQLNKKVMELQEILQKVNKLEEIIETNINKKNETPTI